MSTHFSSRKYIWTNNPLQCRESDSKSPSAWEQSNLKRVLWTCSQAKGRFSFMWVNRNKSQQIMRLLHASAMIIPLVAETKVWYLTSEKWSLLDSDANHTNVTKHLKLIVLSGRCKTSSVIVLKWYQIFLKDWRPALHIWWERKEITHIFFSFFFSLLSFNSAPCSKWANVCSGWERENESCNPYAANRQWNWSYQHKYAGLLPKYKPSWAVIQNWLTGVGKKKSSVYSGLLRAISLLNFGGGSEIFY